MPEYNSELTLSFFTATFMEQFAALGREPGDHDSATKSIFTLKNELAEEKLAREKAQADADTLSQAVEEMKKAVDKLAAHVPSLEAHVKNMNDKIIDLNIELCSRELSLERTTTAKDDFQHQGTRQTKKLKGNHSSPCRLSLMFLLIHY
jgi:chromosome segregation ATPase